MDRFDLTAIFGLLLLSIGCALIYGPLGLIVGGAGLIGLALLGASSASSQHTALQPQSQAFRKDDR